jgi:hypothetical protein
MQNDQVRKSSKTVMQLIFNSNNYHVHKTILEGYITQNLVWLIILLIADWSR